MMLEDAPGQLTRQNRQDKYVLEYFLLTYRVTLTTGLIAPIHGTNVSYDT